MTDEQQALTNPGNTIVIPQQQESVEVERNTKGYNYSVRILGIDLKRLKEITDELNKMYPLIPGRQ